MQVRIEKQNKPCITNFRLFILLRKRIVFTNIIMEREKARTIMWRNFFISYVPRQTVLALNRVPFF